MVIFKCEFLMGQAWTTSRASPNQAPKTWRLFIVPSSGMGACTLDDKLVLSALKNKFDIDPNATLKLSAEKARYCATISLQYEVSPFDNHKPFDLEISTDGGQTIIASVEPDHDFLHVTTLHDGTCKNEDAIDLVVVPGLASHPYGSFKSPDDAKQNWLRDYLPNLDGLPNLRILVYGYDSSLENRESKKSIVDYAIDLLDAILSYRDDRIVARRPIIFLGHSLGGLIVKQALVEATRKQSADDKYKMFLEASYGLLFFGVPNRGLRHEELEAILGHDPNAQLVNDVVVNSDTEMKPFLRLLAENFMVSCETKKLDIVAFYECYATPIAEKDKRGSLAKSKTYKKLMVTQDSATMIDGSSRVLNSIPLDANHSTMVKYLSIHDPLYRIVSYQIKEMVQKALNNMDELFPSQTSKLEEFKKETNIQSQYSSIADPCPRTLENFLEKGYFKQWRDEKESPPLWICGPPGQGKSVLANHLVKHIRQHSMRSPRHTEKTIILSYFCNAQDPSCQPANILRHLLLQLLSYKIYFDLVTNNFWESRHSFSVASLTELFEQFSNFILSVHSRRIYCIIDALDECPQNQHHSKPYYTEAERFMLVKKLKDLFSGNKDRMRLLLTSRPGEDDIERCFRLYRQDLDVTKHDLAIFIDEKLNGLSYLNKMNGMKDRIREQLLSRSGRTFLWVSIVIRELSDKRIRRIKEIDEILMSIPTNLKDMYRKLFNLLAERNSILKMVLVWVVYAKRPLTAGELQAALTYDPYNADDNRYTHLSEMDKYKIPLDDNTIKEDFGSLLTIREVWRIGWCIFFQHQSGKEFFSCEENLALFHDPADINPDKRMARTCLSYLTAKGFDLTVWPSFGTASVLGHNYRHPNWLKLAARYPLLAYASMSWYKHVIWFGNHEEFAPQITVLIDKNYHAYKLWAGSFIATSLPLLHECLLLILKKKTPDDYYVFIHIILLLDVQWLTEKVPDDDLVNHDRRFADMADEKPESFRSICTHRKDRMSQILSADFFDDFLTELSPNKYQSLRILFQCAPAVIESLIHSSRFSSGLLETIQPDREDYCDLIQFFLEKGMTITDNCLLKAARCGKEGTLEFLLNHREIDHKLFDLLLRFAIGYDSDTLSDLLNTSKVKFQVTKDHFASAIHAERLGSFTKLLRHRDHNKQCTEHSNHEFNNEILKLLFYGDVIGDDVSRYDSVIWQKVKDKADFTRQALLKLYRSFQGRIKVTEPILIDSIFTVISITDILKFMGERNIEFEAPAEVIKTVAKRWLDAEEKLRQATPKFQATNPLDFQRSKWLHLPYYVWRTSISSRKVIKILLDHFDSDFKLRKDLLYSAIGENGDILLDSLKSGRVHETRTDQWTALHYATYFHDEQVVEAELESGAAVNGTTCRGLTPLHIAVLSGFKTEKYSDLFGWFVSKEAVYRLIKLLLKYKANPNIRDDNGDIPLHYAAWCGCANWVKELLQSDVNIQDKIGFTPLHYAVCQRRDDVVEMILKQSSVRFTSTDMIFQTPLHYAIECKDQKIIDLFPGSTDFSVLGAYGRTCIELMQDRGLVSKPLPHIPPTSQPRRDTRLRNVVYIITSRLLDDRSGFLHPGFNELGNCLVFLGKAEEALVAYEQMLPNIIDYCNMLCRKCYVHFKCSFYVPINYPTRHFCSSCIKAYKDILAVPGPTFSNRNPNHANDAGESIIEWLERIRREFGVKPEVEPMVEDEGDAASVDNTVGNDEVPTDDEKFAVEANLASVNQAVGKEEVPSRSEELAAVEQSRCDQNGVRDTESKWSQLREAAFGIWIWLIAIIVLASAYTMSETHQSLWQSTSAAEED